MNDIIILVDITNNNNENANLRKLNNDIQIILKNIHKHTLVCQSGWAEQRGSYSLRITLQTITVLNLIEFMKNMSKL